MDFWSRGHLVADRKIDVDKRSTSGLFLVWIFGRAGRSVWSKASDRQSNCRVLLWAENAAGRPAAGRNDVHCAVVAVTVDVFGRAGRSKCGQRLLTDRLTAGSCCGPEKLLAGQRPAAGHDVHCAVVAVTVDVTA